MKFLSNMLPNDTRATELTCSSILLASLLLILFGAIEPHQTLQNIYSIMVLCMIPVLHLAGIIMDKFGKLRVYGSLFTGALMVYLGFLNLGSVTIIGCLSTIVLGFSNLYAFVINEQRLK